MHHKDFDTHVKHVASHEKFTGKHHLKYTDYIVSVNSFSIFRFKWLFLQRAKRRQLEIVTNMNHNEWALCSIITS